VLWHQLPDATAMAPSVRDGWAVATRSAPAFSVSQLYFQEKQRFIKSPGHPEGGRKDVFHMERPRQQTGRRTRTISPGRRHQAVPRSPNRARMARTARSFARGRRDHRQQVRPVTLSAWSAVRTTPAPARLMKRIDDPNFRFLAGACQGDSLPARRAAIGCMLNRLMLLTAETSPNWRNCRHGRTPAKRLHAASVPRCRGLLTGADNPRCAARSDTGPADCAFVTARNCGDIRQDTGFS